MNDDFLWDGAGPPDPVVQRLERSLGALRYQPSPLKAPQKLPTPVWRWVALAATLVAVGVGLWLATESKDTTSHSGIDVTTLAGTPTLDAKALTQTTATLSAGQWLETNDTARVRLTLPLIGQLEVAPNSKIRLVSLDKELQRLELQRGEIKAKVNAPPRLFVIDTPSAKAVDLGCAYTLKVDERGDGLLAVTLGYVELEGHGRSSLVPEGAECHTRVGAGPGTPYFSDAPQEFKDAVARIDAEQGSAQDITTILFYAQPPDSLTLWHLLSRVPEEQRERLVTALLNFAPLPPGVTEAEVLRLDRAALQAWRKKLVVFW